MGHLRPLLALPDSETRCGVGQGGAALLHGSQPCPVWDSQHLEKPGAGPGSASAPKGLWGADSCPPLGWPCEPGERLVPGPELTIEGRQQSKRPVLLHRPTQKGPFLLALGPCAGWSWHDYHWRLEGSLQWASSQPASG